MLLSAVLEAGQGLVHQRQRGGLAAPVHRQLYRLVHDGAPGGGRRPLERLGALGHELPLASEHLREHELAQVEDVVVEGVGSDALHQRLQTVLELGSQLVAQARFELGTSPLRGAEQAHHLLLGRVVVVCVHGARAGSCGWGGARVTPRRDDSSHGNLIARLRLGGSLAGPGRPPARPGRAGVRQPAVPSPTSTVPSAAATDRRWCRSV